MGVPLPLMRPSIQRWVRETAWMARARMAQIRRGLAGEVVSVARAETRRRYALALREPRPTGRVTP